MIGTLPDREGALRFAASLRGARTEDDAVIWALQQGYYAEHRVDEEVIYTLTEKGRDYADALLAGTPMPSGGRGWLLPALALGVLAVGIAKVVRR